MRTGSGPGKARREIPVPEAARILRRVSETETPASTDRETGASHRERPGEKTTSVSFPSGTVRRSTADTRPQASRDPSRRTERFLAAYSSPVPESGRFRSRSV